MIILEALQAINSYPISTTHLEVICIDRDLISTDEYTKVIGASKNYQLATADTYFYLAHHPSLVEQEVGINNAISVKKSYKEQADKIYNEFDDPKYNGSSYGYIGDDFNA